MPQIKKTVILCLLPLLLAVVFSVSIAQRTDIVGYGKQDFAVETNGSKRIEMLFGNSSHMHDPVTSSTQNLTFAQDTRESKEPVFLFILLSLVFCSSSALCGMHLWNNKNPRELAIDIIPSVYAICCYIGISMTSDSALSITVLDCSTEAYSAFALLMFFDLMHANLYNTLQNRDRNRLPESLYIQNIFPITYFQPSKVQINDETTNVYRKYTKQYLIVQLLVSAFLILLVAADIAPWWGVYVLTFVVTFLSGSLALVAVLVFFFAVKNVISADSPGQKLCCIKVSVFFSFYQMWLIRGLYYLGFLAALSPFTLQKYLMLFEMAGLSFYMVYCYLCPPAPVQEHDVESAEDEVKGE